MSCTLAERPRLPPIASCTAANWHRQALASVLQAASGNPSIGVSAPVPGRTARSGSWSLYARPPHPRRGVVTGQPRGRRCRLVVAPSPQPKKVGLASVLLAFSRPPLLNRGLLIADTRTKHRGLELKCSEKTLDRKAVVPAGLRGRRPDPPTLPTPPSHLLPSSLPLNILHDTTDFAWAPSARNPRVASACKDTSMPAFFWLPLSRRIARRRAKLGHSGTALVLICGFEHRCGNSCWIQHREPCCAAPSSQPS